MPTQLWGETTWPTVLGEGASLTPWLGLAAYAALFTALAVWGYRRDEITHYA